MQTMLIRNRWALATLIVNAGLLGCSDGSVGEQPTGTGGGAPVGKGGSLSGLGGGNTGLGGAFVGSGGAVFGTGGSIQPGTGGSTLPGSGGQPSSSGGQASGGANTASGGAIASGGATGGSVSKGGSSNGGSTSSGGASSGGKSSGGAAAGGTVSGTGGAVTNTGAGPSVACGCLKSAGEFSDNPIAEIIDVGSGEVYDGKCMTFRASDALGNGSQDEGQDPIFNINGGTIQNVIIGNSAADGIHILGNATIKNVHWLDIGEDAMSVGSGVSNNPQVTVDCGSSAQGSDKTFQVNAVSTWSFKNFTAKTAGKFMRQNGNSTFKMTLNLDHCDIADMTESIYRTDSSSSIVNMTNTRYHNVGTLFIFGSTEVDATLANTHAQVGTFSGNVSY